MRPSPLCSRVSSARTKSDLNLDLLIIFVLLMLVDLRSAQGQKKPREKVLGELVYEHNKEDENPFEAGAVSGDSPKLEYFYANSHVGSGLGIKDLHLYGIFKGHNGMAAAEAAATAFMTLLASELVYLKINQKKIWDWLDDQYVIRERNRWWSPPRQPDPFPFREIPMHINEHYYIDYESFLSHNLKKADNCIYPISARKDRIQECSTNSGSIFTIVLLDGVNSPDDVFVINSGDSHAIIKDAKGVTQLTSKEPIDPTKGKSTIGDFHLESKNFVTGHYKSYSSVNQDIQFLLLASKGLWDNFTNEEAATYMSNCLQAQQPCTAKNLAIESYDKYKDKQSENITVIFVDLRTF